MKPLIPIKTSQTLMQYLNRAIAIRICKKKLLLKAAREQKNFARLRKFFHISISRSIKNSGMNKNHSLFAPLFAFVQRQIHSNFFHAFNFPLQKSLQ